MGREYKPLESGTVFGRLTVIGKDEETTQRTKRQYYFCQCSCGSPVKSIWKASLVDKRKPTLSCGCIVREKAGFTEDRANAIKKLLYMKMKERHIKVLSDDEDTLISIESFSKRVEEPCYYCGMRNSSFKKDRATDYILYYNGLDRIDSSIGYRKENTVVACKMCNIAKAEMTVDEFRKYLIRLHEYQASLKEN